FHHFLNPRRMNPPVSHQFLQGDPGNLPADRIKTGQNDRFRSVVNDQIDPRQRFQGSDIPPLPADDPPLHLVIGKGDNGNGGFRHMIGGAALDGQRQYVARPLVRFLFRLLLHLLDHLCRLLAHFVFHTGQDLLPRLLDGQSRDELQLLRLLLFQLFGLFQQLLDFPFLFIENVLGTLQGLLLAVESLFLLHQTPLQTVQFIPLFPDFPLRFRAKRVGLVAGLQHLFLFHCLGFLKGILDDALGFLFRTADPRLRRQFPPPVTEASADQARDQADNQDGYIRHSPLPPPPTATYKTRPIHFGLASLIL